MENKKSIEHLNTKAWYRLVKVFFGIGFLVVLVIFNIIAFSGGVKKVDQNETIVKCNNADKTSLALKDINVNLNSSDFKDNDFDYGSFFKGYNEYSLKEILRACYPKTVNNFGTSFIDNNTSINDVYDFQKAAEIKNQYGLADVHQISQAQTESLNIDYKDYLQKSKGVYGNSKSRFLDFSYKLFDITPKFTYDGFLKLFFIGNLVILIVFEGIRRMFYYIALGNLKPEK